MKNKDSKVINQSLDVVGIGNAIVDVIIKTEDSYLNKLNLNKGSMTLIDEQKAEELYKSVEGGIQSSGGSVANTLACISQLGGKAGFIGRVSNDKLGKIFTDEISKSGAIFQTPPSTQGPSTARCLILVTPDAQRTMCTFLGASVLLDPLDLDLSLVEKAKILYLEGYLWDHPSAKKAFIKAAEVSKKSGNKVALSLSDSFCVERHRESFINLVEDYIDILFANESEIKSLYQNPDLNFAISKIQNECELIAITRGSNGSILLAEGKKKIIKPFIIGEAIDTTGAGDLYAGGFLKGLTSGLSPHQSAMMGSLCAGQIVTQLGSRSNTSLQEIIKQHLDSEINISF